MMLRIETTRDDASTVLRLIGRIDSQSVPCAFLKDCESRGIAVRHGSPYIRAWMDALFTEE